MACSIESIRMWTASIARASSRAIVVLPVPGRPPRTISITFHKENHDEHDEARHSQSQSHHEGHEEHEVQTALILPGLRARRGSEAMTRGRAYCLISTSATLLTPLQASARLLSAVRIMLRTTPPPDRMAHVWNFPVVGSKRTRVFGRTADSLYQTALPIVAMPYGCESAPPGERNSRIEPVFGS